MIRGGMGMRIRKIVAMVAGCVALSGCLQQLTKAAQGTCESYGFTQGTDAHAECIERDVARRQNLLFSAGQTASGNYTPVAPSPLRRTPMSPVPAGPTFLKGSYVSGASRICTYDRMGSPYVITVGAAEICPFSPP